MRDMYPVYISVMYMIKKNCVLGLGIYISVRYIMRTVQYVFVSQMISCRAGI